MSKKKKRLQTIKLALWLFVVWCLAIQIYCLIMIWRTGDSTSLSILTGASVGELVAIFKIYSDHSTKEKLKHMEMNYDPNYNENNNIR